MRHPEWVDWLQHRRDPRGGQGGHAPPLFKDAQRIFLLLIIHIRVMNLWPPHFEAPSHACGLQDKNLYYYTKLYNYYQ